MARGRSSDIRRELRKVIPEAEANKLAREIGAVRRQRQVRIYGLVRVLVLGFATSPKRTLSALRRRYERQTGQYHLNVTNIPPETLQAEDMPSAKRVVVETPL